MVSEQLVDQLMAKVLASLQEQSLEKEKNSIASSLRECPTSLQSLFLSNESMPTIVNASSHHSIGLMIPRVSPHLLSFITSNNNEQSIGIISSTQHIFGHLMAVDQGIRHANCHLLHFSQPKDPFSQIGYAALTILASNNLSELENVIQHILTDITQRSKTTYYFDVGYMEWQYCSMAGELLKKQYQIPTNAACAIINVAPAALALFLFNQLTNLYPVTINHCDLPLNHHHSINSGKLVISGGINEIRYAMDYIRQQGALIRGHLFVSET